MTKKSLWPVASLFFCAILYLIWPIAHTIALRKVLLVITAGIGLLLLIRSDDRYEILRSPWLILLGVLLAWVIFHAGFISQNGVEAWRELLGQWIPAYLAVFSGIGLALAGRKISPSRFKIYLLVVMAAQPVLFLLVSIYTSMQLGKLAIGWTVVTLGTDLKTSLTFSSDMLAALACAQILESYKAGNRNIKTYLWLVPIILALFVAIFTQTLNSILLISACFILMAVMIAYNLKIKLALNRSRITIIILITAISIYCAGLIPSVGLGYKRILSNSTIASNIDAYTNWTNFQKLGMPSNNMGEQLPESFYLRVAYAKAGLRTVFEHPWGYGVTRHAFERLVQQKYPDASIANAHNGYLNLGCAVGIPGLILFGMMFVVIFRQLKESSSELANPAIWMIGIYLAHWLTDALERDHFFESYLFVVAMLLVHTSNKSSGKEALKKY